MLYQSSSDGERHFSDRVARNVVEAMLDVAPHDDLALPGGRPVAAKTGTVQSHVIGQNNDAWMAGFTPDVATAVWLGTDRNVPIRTASGKPIEGKDLPGKAWHTFMVRATSGPERDFAPFHPIGTPPSNLPPDVDPRRQAVAPPTATPTPDPTPTLPAPPAPDPSATAAPDPAQPPAPAPASTPAPDASSTCTLLSPYG